MKSFWFPTVVVVVVAVATTASQIHDQVEDSWDVHIWPQPESASHGEIGHRAVVSKNLQMKILGGGGEECRGRNHILEEGFSRFLDVVMNDHVVVAEHITLFSSAFPPPPLLKEIRVSMSSSISEIQYGVDESYKLEVPSPTNGEQSYIYLKAKTVFGALHGLETLSQLCHFHFETQQIQIKKVPWIINDRPRFRYRGVLMDTARHFLPVRTILKLIDGMAITKLNVLHWHIVDDQSFPLQIPSYPLLWKGSYTYRERYTMADVAFIVSYAEKRGINVMPEIDVPGHAVSWGKGYPILWPSETCKQPLDVSKEFTFEVIKEIIADLRKVFKFKFIHLGGDEVDTNCWNTTEHINKWLKKNRRSESSAYEYFVLRVHEIARSEGYEVINWEETYRSFKGNMSKKTVIHNWLSGLDTAADVTADGFPCIVSNMDAWYLDFPEREWRQVYKNDPLQNIKTKEQIELVMGGEVCLWGEKVDASDAEQTLWPRAAAAAEMMWTPFEKLSRKVVASKRLAHFRCLLNQRGVAAAPLHGPGRVVPSGPMSCYLQ